MPWSVEILNATVAAEIAGGSSGLQARFLRLSDRICQAGLKSLGEPHVKYLEGKLWELRLLNRTARQLPDHSTTLWVESSSTSDPRLRGALP